jgi:hypothetical protein
MLADPSVAKRLIFEGREPDYIDSPSVSYWRVRGHDGVFMEVRTSHSEREVHMIVPRSEVKSGRMMATRFLDMIFARQQVQTVKVYVTSQTMVNFCLKLGFEKGLANSAMTAMTLYRRVWVSAAPSIRYGASWGLSEQQSA